MMRPLLGHYVASSGITDAPVSKKEWKVMPNPARDVLQFEFDGEKDAIYKITNVQGKALQSGTVSSGNTIDISHLVPGLYFVNIISNGIAGAPQKVIKL